MTSSEEIVPKPDLVSAGAELKTILETESLRQQLASEFIETLGKRPKVTKADFLGMISDQRPMVYYQGKVYQGELNQLHPKVAAINHVPHNELEGSLLLTTGEAIYLKAYPTIPILIFLTNDPSEKEICSLKKSGYLIIDASDLNF